MILKGFTILSFFCNAVKVIHRKIFLFFFLTNIQYVVYLYILNTRFKLFYLKGGENNGLRKKTRQEGRQEGSEEGRQEDR